MCSNSNSPLGTAIVTAEMQVAAQRLITTFTPSQRAQAIMPFEDAERFNWHYVPRNRAGLSLKEMTPEQRPLAYALIATGLSQRGYAQALNIMSIEAVLAEIEQGRGPLRDPEWYHISFFGEPENDHPWGWRVEGHHLSLNFTTAPQQHPSWTPSFFGSNPAQVMQGPRTGLRILAEEEDLARQLMHLFDEEQRQAALIAVEAPHDILHVPGCRDWTKPAGLPQSRMTPHQSTLLRDLVRFYLYRLRAEIADVEWAKIENLSSDSIFFAWAGGMEAGDPHYYRVQGAGFVLEYDNTQNGANHVHTVWHDLTNNFGADALKAHYEHSSHHQH
jgi:hypothetical protein